MASTEQMHGEDAWAWPCPYCRTSNALEASVCVGCGAQLRDPQEDDLFTTVATDNAQMVDPNAPRVKESLWSTEAPPEELVAEEVVDVSQPAAPQYPPAQPGPVQAPPPMGSGPYAAEPQPAPPPVADVPLPGAPAGEPAANGSSGPFSANAPSTSHRQGEDAASPFAATAPVVPGVPAEPAAAPDAGGPFGPAGAAPQPPPQQPPPTATSAEPVAGQPADHAHRPTPDEHGLSIAVESLAAEDRERCDTPIAVCGALLGEQEVVLGLVAGHLLGHPAVIALTSTRVLVANARRWKPLVDQFIPGPDLLVHLRHDRDVASITFVQGDRLTGVDDITDVTAAVDLAERIRATATRSTGTQGA
ncbi:MAG: hypothetical protein GY812_17180 [Actinomycetia bacterium]|nr:hypothetical protein [Actinomycetes bacterium]